MKKLFSVFLVSIFTFLLFACVKEPVVENYTVDFYYEEMFLNRKTYQTGDFINYEDIELFENSEILHLINFQNNEIWDLGNEIKSDLVIIVILKAVNIEESNIFDIYYLNDMHGAVLRDNGQLGLSYISNFIKNDGNYNSIFITGGDMFQGQLISNDNRGKVMIESFNEMKLDAFVIGNHEFDWGLDTVLEYFNPNTEGVKANFPILGANIIDKRTGKRPIFIDSHTIIERSGYKIGIIGVIGDGQESSILTPRVENYAFTNGLEAVKTTHNLIKNEVDIVIVGTHSGDQYFTEEVAKLDKVNAVLHAHNHSRYEGYASKNKWKEIPYLQSGTKGSDIGKITLKYQLVNNQLTFISGLAKNINSSPHLQISDKKVDLVIDKYYKDVERLYKDELLTASRNIGVTDLANYIAKMMADTSNAVAGFQNSGGTRGTLKKGQSIKAADLFEIFPFDNKIISAEISGSSLKQMLANDYFFKNSNINIYEINDYQYYKIATNDYIFSSNYNKNLFRDARNIELVGDMYEIWYQVMLNYKELGYKEFDTDLPIIYEG